MAARNFREKKNNKNESFFPLNFIVYINLDNGERGRARNKYQRRPISLEEKHENYIAAVRKWEILAATKVKTPGGEKTEWTGTQTDFLHKKGD